MTGLIFVSSFFGALITPNNSWGTAYLVCFKSNLRLLFVAHITGYFGERASQQVLVSIYNHELVLTELALRGSVVTCHFMQLLIFEHHVCVAKLRKRAHDDPVFTRLLMAFDTTGFYNLVTAGPLVLTGYLHSPECFGGATSQERSKFLSWAIIRADDLAMSQAPFAGDRVAAGAGLGC